MRADIKSLRQFVRARRKFKRGEDLKKIIFTKREDYVPLPRAPREVPADEQTSSPDVTSQQAETDEESSQQSETETDNEVNTTLEEETPPDQDGKRKKKKRTPRPSSQGQYLSCQLALVRCLQPLPLLIVLFCQPLVRMDASRM